MSFEKSQCQFFLSGVKMVEQGDQPIKLEIFVFDGETFEQKSRKMFERT